MKKLLGYFLPLLIGVGLLFFVFNKIDLKEVWGSFRQANYMLVIFAMVLSLFSHLLRASRWTLLLRPMGYSPSFFNSSVAVLTGYITNLVFPRAGEVARAVSLQKSEKVNFERSLGTIVTERVIDMLVLLVLVLVNLLLEYERIITFFGELNINIGRIGIFVLVFGMIGSFIVYRYRDFIFKKPPFSKLKPFLVGLKDGLTSIFKLEKPALFIVQSVGIWVLYFLITLILCYAIDVGTQLSPLAVLTVFVMGTIGMAIPTTGGIGSYHLLVGKIVLLYGLTSQQGIALATFLHTLNGIVFVIIFGVVALGLNVLYGKSTAE